MSSRPDAVVVVVDDDPSIRAILRHLFTAEGFVVHVAADGEEAWALMERIGTTDLLVSDINMPNLTGLELLERLRAAKNEVPVIFISSDLARQDAALGAATYFLPKPFLPEALLAKVRLALARPPICSPAD